MKVNERAGRPVEREIILQPDVLLLPCRQRRVAVQGHDVPSAQVVAVITEAEVARVGAEVIEVRCGARRIVLVIAWTGTRAPLVPPPRFVVAVGEVRSASGGIRVVAGREDGALNAVEQSAGRLGRSSAVVIALPDVAGADEDGGDRRLRRIWPDHGGTA